MNRTRTVPVGLLVLATLVSGCTSPVKTYLKPGADLSQVQEIAIASFASDPKYPETARGAAELPAFLQAVMSAKGYAVIDVQKSLGEISKIAPPGKELSPEILADLGAKLNVKAVLKGIVMYYGSTEAVEPAEVTSTARPQFGSATPAQRRLGFRSRELSRVQPGFTTSPAAVVTEYRVTVRLELFDVKSKSVLWWAECSAGGEQDHMKTYANEVFEALLARFPVRPTARK